MNTKIFALVTFIYLFSFVLYLISVSSERKKISSVANYVTGLGFLLHAVGLITRWVESHQQGFGYAPLSNFYESLVFFAFSLVAVYFYTARRAKSDAMGVFILPLAFLLMAFASITPGMSSAIEPLIPALQSNWLISHVITCFLGYAGFTLAFALAIIYSLRGTKLGFLCRGISPELTEQLMYTTAAFGFVLLTIGIITGSIWAHYAWGSYWSWDPKEVWSLITWLVYVVMLHSRYVRGWGGKKMAIFALIGFVCVIITYLGVNYLPGLHSYL
ncbi:MAG: c-type cytochrome biogenesis protein CcsB [Deltaproteobacteria bacterium]|nr:c-type cytochrome biogenesis protein CcsB [Deltaproteobacteria bacterium]